MPVVAAIAAVPAVSSGVKSAVKAAEAVVAKIPVVGGALQKSDPETDQHRIDTTRAAVNKAVAGDVNALAYVRARAGKGAAIQIPGYGLVGGWGSGPAKAFAAEQWYVLANNPSLARQVESAKALWGAQGAATNTIGETLARPVGATGIPLWALAVLVGLGALLIWRWMK